MTDTNATRVPPSSEGGTRACTRCKVNQADPKHRSWCRPCLRAQAAEYRARTRPKERTEVRACQRRGCERTFTWRSTHPKQRFCCKDCYTQGVLDERKAAREARRVAREMAGMRRCVTCKLVKPEDEFSPAGHACRTCTAETQRRWREANPERVMAQQRLSARRRLLDRYGLTEETWSALIVGQSGLCLLCDVQLREPHVDHDHDTGRVRGLLCHACNVRLHQGVTLDWMLRAIHYLGLEPS